MALDDSASEEDEEYGDDKQEEGSDMESDLEGKKDAGKIIVYSKCLHGKMYRCVLQRIPFF